MKKKKIEAIYAHCLKNAEKNMDERAKQEGRGFGRKSEGEAAPARASTGAQPWPSFLGVLEKQLEKLKGGSCGDRLTVFMKPGPFTLGDAPPALL